MLIMPAKISPLIILEKLFLSRRRDAPIMIITKNKYVKKPLLRPYDPYKFCEIGDALWKIEIVENRMNRDVIQSKEGVICKLLLSFK